MAAGIEPIDDDGDSEDWDGDGYPQGQESQYGTSDWDVNEFPGSGRFVETDWLSWEEFEVTGNYTYNGNALIQEYTWIANNLVIIDSSILLNFEIVSQMRRMAMHSSMAHHARLQMTKFVFTAWLH